MTAQEIRNAYLRFYEERQHVVIPRAPIVLKDDPTTLFTGSGMQPMIPYLLGEEHPKGKRIVDSQTCLRAQDIDDIGDNRHTIFFEMLGNWSLGDYFKKEQLPWMYEFLLDVVELDINKIYATCFIGDDRFDLPKDTESADLLVQIFKDRGIDAQTADIGSAENGYARGMKPGERIFFYDGYDNWWWRGKGVAEMLDGEPGGPCSEMFYRFDDSEHTEDEKQKYGELCHPACDCGRFMEIGNNVFMEYIRRGEGFEKLPSRNVDQGSGLERIAAAAIDSPDVFRISVMWPIIEKLEKLSKKKYEDNTESMRVIADHLRAATFLAVDGCVPSNKEQGYVMRRLLRRAVRYSFELGVEQNFLQEVVPVIADLYHDDFPEVAERRDEVIAVLVKEEKVFRQTLRKGLKEFERIYAMKTTGMYDAGTKPPDLESFVYGSDLFKLYDTYGFPIELSIEEAKTRGIKLEENAVEKFNDLMLIQRNMSKTAAKGTFKGGLGGQTLQHKKYHTATHLMYQALRDVLGDHVVQHGSNITEERLRFDFSHPEKVTPEQLKQVEDIVNEQISRDLKVSFAEYPTPEATGPLGALGQFGDRYGDTVKVYKMIADDAETPFSFEICGGPHVDHTLQLSEEGKKFKILKEESSSAGIRRIKAALV
jgi:alanyl-tRNA synthetase